MTVRPEVRRRARTVEELAEIANVPRFVVRERIDRIQRLSRHPAAVVWRGSGWVLSDVAWRQFLGADFAFVLELGGFQAYNGWVRRAAAKRRPRAALRRIAGRFGEDL